MLQRLVGQVYYYFLNSCLGYNHIVVDPKDQEKIVITFPFEIFAYGRISFGLCNALTTFQICMIVIFQT